MDAEGAEWSILPDLVAKNLLCKDKVRKIYIELHAPNRGHAINEAYKTACPNCDPTLAGIQTLQRAV